jgi:serine protease Do
MPNSTAFSQVSDACAAVVAEASSAIVQVLGRPRHPASGVLVAHERVVTTNHSVAWEEHLAVKAHGQRFDATIAGRDPRTDLILLRVPGLSGTALPTADAPATGSLALVVGRTWSGQAHARLAALTHITGPVRVGWGRALDSLISLDVGPYPGFSGSAVVLPDGRLAGLATAGLMRGAGLAVPVTLLRPTLDALERDGAIRRGFLGISSQPVEVPEAQRAGSSYAKGLLVASVAAGAPAAQAGVLVGDIVVALDGDAVADPEDLLARLTAERVGSAARLSLVRGTQLTEATVTIGERPTR